MHFRICFVAYGLLLSGCVTIQTVTIDEKTALEMQIMGDREVWDDKAALEMSKRDVEAVIDPGFSDLLNARQAQRFLRDEWFDVFDRNCASFSDTQALRLDCETDEIATNLWEKEQSLRETIFSWLYENRTYFAGLDEAEARQVFESLLDQKLANAYTAFSEAAKR